jgi:hypothetical protein
MKRATTITLLCMGVGAAFVANAYERNCDPDDNADAAALNAAAPAQTTKTFCRSSSGYSHTYSHSHSSSGYGFASSGVSRGGFGGSGHHSGS